MTTFAVSKRVLVVDDDPAILRQVRETLAGAGYQVFEASNGSEALHEINQYGLQIVITDCEMPVMDGLTLCRAIRTLETMGFVYTIVLTAHSRHVAEALEAGADDFLSKPPRRGELLARLKAATRIISLEADLAKRTREICKANAELAVLNRKLEEMATTDELTGLFNRRMARQRLREFWEVTARTGQPLAGMMIDIDHFKGFNDAYGHDVGDRVLREVARVLGENTRGAETVYRIGGEEFLVLCLGSTAAELASGGERLRRAVEQHDISCGSLRLGVTVSVGVAESDERTRDSEDLVKKMDLALYAAKDGGRNRVKVANGVNACTASECNTA